MDSDKNANNAKDSIERSAEEETRIKIEPFLLCNLFYSDILSGMKHRAQNTELEKWLVRGLVNFDPAVAYVF